MIRMRQLRIALISDWFLPRRGGIELQVRDLAAQLAARGHDVEIITPVPGPDTEGGVRVHRIDAQPLPGAGIVFTPTAFQLLRALLVARRYDVAHVHFGIIAPFAYGATAIAQSLGIQTIATFHSVLHGFQLPLRAIRGALGVDAWAVQWTAVSSVVAESMRPLVGDRPVALLPNGIDRDWWTPRGNERPVLQFALPAAQPFRIVSVMRLHRRKRPHALVDSLLAASRALPDGQALDARIYGDGPERRSVEQAIVRNGLEQQVRLMGWQDRAVIRSALHQADLFILPSRLEAFGIAALEARSAGVPVIAMRVGGVSDFLRDGTDSCLVSTDQELCDVVAELVSSSESRAVLQRGCRTPLMGFDWPAIVDRHESFYAAADAPLVFLDS